MLTEKTALTDVPTLDAEVQEILRLDAEKKLRTCLRCGRVWKTTRTRRFCPRCASSDGFRTAMTETRYESGLRGRVSGEFSPGFRRSPELVGQE